VAEAASDLGVSQHFIRKAIDEGVLPAIKVGRLIRIPRLPLLRLLGAEPSANGGAQT
jgi:excisionase family DNA binding protein